LFGFEDQNPAGDQSSPTVLSTQGRHDLPAGEETNEQQADKTEGKETAFFLPSFERQQQTETAAYGLQRTSLLQQQQQQQQQQRSGNEINIQGST
jgi:hypothetical protein